MTDIDQTPENKSVARKTLKLASDANTIIVVAFSVGYLGKLAYDVTKAGIETIKEKKAAKKK